MEVELSRHAKRQMKWRKITAEEIKEVVMDPEFKENCMYGRKNAYRKIGGRSLKVTYKYDREKLVIITAVVKGR